MSHVQLVEKRRLNADKSIKVQLEAVDSFLWLIASGNFGPRKENTTWQESVSLSVFGWIGECHVILICYLNVSHLLSEWRHANMQFNI